jgi:hypothetical protein
VTFSEFALTVDDRTYDDVVFDHAAAFAAWGPVVVELNQVHAIDDRLAAAFNPTPSAVSHVSWVVPDVRAESARLAQRRLWGTNPRAWADLAEAHNQPLFEAVLDAAQVSPGTRLLDVGCGSGLTLMLATQRGARPSGLDISPGLLEVARNRIPGADLREGDMEFLPHVPLGSRRPPAMTGWPARPGPLGPTPDQHRTAGTPPGGRPAGPGTAAPAATRRPRRGPGPGSRCCPSRHRRIVFTPELVVRASSGPDPEALKATSGWPAARP